MTRAGRQGCPLFDLMHPAFPLPTTASPTLQGALKDGFGEAVVACDMPEPCKFPSFHSSRRGSCGPTRKLTSFRTRSLVLCSKWEIRRSFLRHLVPKAWIVFFRVSKQGPCFRAFEEDGGDERLVELELALEADGVAPPDLV